MYLHERNGANSNKFSRSRISWMPSVLLLVDGDGGGGSFDAATMHVLAIDDVEDSYHFNSNQREKKRFIIRMWW